VRCVLLPTARKATCFLAQRVQCSGALRCRTGSADATTSDDMLNRYSAHLFKPVRAVLTSLVAPPQMGFWQAM